MSKDIEIHGTCDERFENVREAFAENFRTGLDVGASLAVTLEGKFVVDLWAGYADAARTRPWEQDTIVNVFSSTKVMTAICTLMLVDRGLLDLDTPVAEYWPEFAQEGKEKLPVRYLLSHSSGLPGWNDRFPIEKLYDWEYCVNKLASQKPWWEPGTKSGYHAITFGYLLGELVRRITGKSIGTFFQEEVAKPLNADFHIGLSEEHDTRVATLIPPKLRLLYRFFGNRLFRKLLFFHPAIKVLTKPDLVKVVDETTTRAWRAAEIPAANGHGNARSMARVAAVVACGGELDGVYLLSAATLEKALETQIESKDLVLRTLIRFGLGFGLPNEVLKFPSPRTLFWGGFGGSVIVMDLDKKVSAAFAMNKMTPSVLLDPRKERLLNTLYETYEKI